MQNAN